MTFDEILEQTLDMLQRRGRVSYGALRRQFDLDPEYLEDLKVELIDVLEVAADKDGKMLVWTGSDISEDTSSQTEDAPAAELSPSAPPVHTERAEPAGERRQLTVMFCDLVGSTSLSEQLDSEDLQTVVRTYQEVSAQVIERYDGYIAQYLGDGLLVYFGYPAAHEDDAARSIRAGLEIITALHEVQSQFPHPVQVRIGIHTGPVVVGQMGGGSRQERLALGETPNIAARVQAQAEPNRVVISAATARLVPGLFDWQPIGVPNLKGVSTPLELYHIQGESTAQSRFEVAVRTGLTPLVGRDHELGVLQERWTQAQAGNGQVVLLSGEPGIGKSRLVEELKAQLTAVGATPVEFRCSPYHQNSALYPVIEHLQRLLQFTSDDSPDTKLAKLQQRLAHYRFPQATTLPLLAALLSLPHPADTPPLTMSPAKQKELLQSALVAWLVEETEQQPVYNAWEDLHWADPSTLEVLGLLLSQVPTSRLLAVLTFRPEFIPPWGTHSYLSQLALSRLGHPQVSAMVERVTGGKALPDEVVEQIVTKTDGVPLFVEELTKMVVESGLVQAVNNHYELTGPLPPLAIPSTLQDSLMARLDRLATVKDVAQLGATIGREFSYALLHAVSPLDDVALQRGLGQLVEAELVFQRGVPPDARYLFKHALIQDTAYASLLKSRRQQLHQQVAQVLEQQFAEVKKTQPELVAHHYTEAGLIAQAIPYWQQAGQRAIERSAYTEAINHLTKGLDILKTLPDTTERARQELALQVALGSALPAAKGWTGPEIGQVYSRACELSQLIGDISQLFPSLWGLWAFCFMRNELPKAHTLAEDLFDLAQSRPEEAPSLAAYMALGYTSYALGKLVAAHEHFEQGARVYNLQDHHFLAASYGGADPGITCLTLGASTLWMLGYPKQAQERMQEAITLGQKLSHPHSLAWALTFAAEFHYLHRDLHGAQERAEATIALSTEQGFTFWLELVSITRGWVLAKQGQGKDGIAQSRQGLAAYRSRGAEMWRPHLLAMVAEAHGTAGQTKEGLDLVDEALELAQSTDLQYFDAELHRLKGELTLQLEARDRRLETSPPTTQASSPKPQVSTTVAEEAGECFLKAIAVAQRQQAKSLELRATVSLARLWQQQGKTAEARQMLAEVYNWFTEGFDTKDLQEAKALLEELP